MKRLIKRAANSLLALALLVSPLAAGPALAANEATFTDVAGKYGEAAILKLHALGVVNGYEDGDFHPEDPVTRAQFAVMMTRALKLETLAESMKAANTFPDTVVGYDWAKGAINLAAARGWITGYPDGNFGPNDQISHEQMAAILVRALGVELEVTSPWYLSAVLAAEQLGLTDETFRVGIPATRGQVAQAIDSFLMVPIDGAGKYREGGTGRVTSQTHPIKDATNLASVTVITQAADPGPPPVSEVTRSYDLRSIPVYGRLATGAQLEVFFHGGSPFMARVVDLVKSLEVVGYVGGGSHIAVKEGGREVVYELNPVIPGLVPGGIYNFTFNAEGQVIAAEVDHTAVAGEIVEGKSIVGGATYRVVLGGQLYIFDRSAYEPGNPADTYWLKRRVIIDGTTYDLATLFVGDEGWKAMAVGDRLVVKEWHGARIRQAEVTAGSIVDAVVLSPLENHKIVFGLTFGDYELDLRLYPELTLTRGGVASDFASLEGGERVTLRINPVTTKLVGVEAAASSGLEGKVIDEG